MKNGHYAVLDVETGGFSAKQNPITQIALIILDKDSLQEITRWQTFVKVYDGLVITPEALKKSTVTMEDVRKGLDIKEVVDKIITIMNMKEVTTQKTGKYAHMYKPVIVGHNVTFDIGFIRSAFQRVGRENAFEEIFSVNNGEVDYEDTMKMGKAMWDGNWPSKDDDKSLNLTACCKRAGITLIGAHGAMEDTQATAELFRFYLRALRGKTKEVKGKSAAIEMVQTEKSRTKFAF